MIDKKHEEFLRKLTDLLYEYNASIGFTCGSGSDTYGLCDEGISIDIGKTNVVRTYDWWIDARDLKQYVPPRVYDLPDDAVRINDQELVNKQINRTRLSAEEKANHPYKCVFIIEDLKDGLKHLWATEQKDPGIDSSLIHIVRSYGTAKDPHQMPAESLCF